MNITNMSFHHRLKYSIYQTVKFIVLIRNLKKLKIRVGN